MYEYKYENKCKYQLRTLARALSTLNCCSASVGVRKLIVAIQTISI